MNPKVGSIKKGFLWRLGQRYSQRRRAARAAWFRATFELTENTRVLDLGGSVGAHIHSVLQGTAVRPENVYIADICKGVERARASYGYNPVKIVAGQPLPFETGFFDVVFCSSVIEHVTVSKEEIWELNGVDFARRSIAAQRAFADEICRIGKGFWVQTPARSFVIETHSWLPFVGWFPRRVQLAIFKMARYFWFIHHAPNFYLLTRGHIEALFPHANIIAERSLGMTKSWVAARTPQGLTAS